MPSPINDLRGRRFGRLRVPRDAEPEIRNDHAYWPCRCDCRRVKWIRGSKLVSGRIVSCGCWRADSQVRKAAWVKRKKNALARSGERVAG
jgi:hypothetical protein